MDNIIKGKRILITHVFIQRLMGSTVLTLELADYLQQQGADVTVFCSEYAEPVRSLFEERHLKVIDDENHDFHLADYDIIWLNSQVLPLSLVEELKHPVQETLPAFIFNHMSALDKIADEFPYIYGLEERLASLVLTIAPEVERKILPYFDVIPPHALFPNPAPTAFSELHHDMPEQTLKRVLIVSNHAPQEIHDAAALLESRGIEVAHFGEGGGRPTLVTPERLSGYDAVITIGKTVQYCLTAGIPVYVYDHFGGFGYLDDGNFALAAENNFSGRGGSQHSAEYIADDIITHYPQALAYHTHNRESFINRYSIDCVLPVLLQSVHKRQIEPFSSAYTLSVLSAERGAYRFYRTWSWANYLEDERARLTTRLDQTSEELGNVRAALQTLQDSEARLQHRLQEIESSHAFRIGKVLMLPPHLIKVLTRRLLRRS
ncbi:hypothetical protein JS531_10045 [Bifidobacterium sp. CP2]|uniref:hypothetical protein n=1 Tax=Bifidobacterium TaxID=1678 RepID=UPI001BDC77BC|nr:MULTISPECIES: hypothetical protein [Bifidobacterium]MBT1182277.1 hypothetical protein [Bifidobacterium sp. CP2]MBW3081341.1 hypothetical protein [Bifidobacterium saguinibicoloris]